MIWFEVGIDRDGETDGWNINWDTSQLREGPYLIRARMTDTAGNTAESPPAPLVVRRSFAAWKTQHGVGSGAEDLDGDGFSAMEEYYHGFDPNQVELSRRATRATACSGGRPVGTLAACAANQSPASPWKCRPHPRSDRARNGVSSPSIHRPPRPA